ncbi:unnamed protein product (macronuclear) [Paramecium tetraurelia]|uniref:EF-hand domain-containing protein n=1 Tax=Paramecium tetraurelia TaxID=5888 RepID=A0EHL4_PARTE|nr:uncharacterized protein GSPATT00027131001 [Paramecium tetraurelia]CAK94805.1 unnamed protein product [Paramecium tetraurelia]|eukprot:XP_001462178.1 hypothetical protein (macronuclear) [Paramecium tetraurelia strain d4-2]
MIQIPYANQQLSQIKIAESQITNIDKNIIRVLQLFSITGQLDMDIENIRLELSDNSNFYPEALFTYLKTFAPSSIQNSNQYKQKFFDFSDLQSSAPLVINIINSSKDGIIQFQNLLSFLNDFSQTPININQIKCLERIYHVDQYAFQQDQAIDSLNNEYPLPQDVTPISKNKQTQIQGTTKVPLAKQESLEKVNSGEGFNYSTFKKLILSQSIPLAKQKAQKRKLIYETNQQQKVEINVLKQFAKLIQYELELLDKSEQIRLQLNTDKAYNHVGMFNILDAHGNGEIEFQYIEQLMNKAQIPFKPQAFKALVRRTNLLSNNNSLSECMIFEGFRLLTTVQNPYFKIPKPEVETLPSNIEYSRILGAEVTGQNSSQLSISRIPDKLKNSTQNYRSKPIIPLYNSSNPYVNETLKKQSKIYDSQKQNYDTIQNDYIVYGTKREWEELQHSMNSGVLIDTQSLKSQIQRIQNSQINFQSNASNSKAHVLQQKTEIQLIQQQALEEDLERRKNQDLSKQLQHAMNANTKGYYSNLVKIEKEKRNTEEINEFVVQAPWYQNDMKINKNVNLIKKQQEEIHKFSGLNQPYTSINSSQQNLQNNSSKLPPKVPKKEGVQTNIQPLQQQQNNQQEQPAQSQIISQQDVSPIKSRIFSSQKYNPLIYQDNLQQKIMDYKCDIPTRQFDYQN